MPNELSFLITDKTFENSLSPKLKEVKDFFVFGCTVALRFSDLIALKKSNIRIANGQYYLVVKSVKTSTDSMIKLPPYAVTIIEKYKKQKQRLLPAFNKVNLNKYIKELLEQAGLVHPVQITRNQRGKTTAIRPSSKQTTHRFCDVATTHTMRRTAITTMLSLGVSEPIVRKISGHAPGSKDFYRYVFWAQTYEDQEVDKMFGRLQSVSGSVR